MLGKKILSVKSAALAVRRQLFTVFFEMAV